MVECLQIKISLRYIHALHGNNKTWGNLIPITIRLFFQTEKAKYLERLHEEQISPDASSYSVPRFDFWKYVSMLGNVAKISTCAKDMYIDLESLADLPISKVTIIAHPCCWNMTSVASGFYEQTDSSIREEWVPLWTSKSADKFEMNCGCIAWTYSCPNSIGQEPLCNTVRLNLSFDAFQNINQTVELFDVQLGIHKTGEPIPAVAPISTVEREENTNALKIPLEIWEKIIAFTDFDLQVFCFSILIVGSTSFYVIGSTWIVFCV